ncbi:MAG: hypothetical protein HOY79_12250 [Streptomyces sp.]|nr:hypothetical protein [Streptomyces sp.]
MPALTAFYSTVLSVFSVCSSPNLAYGRRIRPGVLAVAEMLADALPA